jgi:hypothetical protein
MGLLFAAGFVATLGMDGSLHYPLGYSQGLIAAIALLFLASAARDWREVGAAAASPGLATGGEAPVGHDAPGGLGPLVATIALSIAYVAACPVIGYYAATFLYVAGQLWLLRQRHWAWLLGVPAATTLLVYVVFAWMLSLPFPAPMWAEG